MGKEINKILGDLGEISVSYELKKRNWKVFKNVGGDGFDFLIEKGHKARRIEVKSSDPDNKSGKNSKYLTFGKSEKQEVDADYLIYYAHGFSAYFIIPLNKSILELNDSRNGNTLGSIENMTILPNEKFERYFNCWEVLE